jgi:hypothetical protein
MKNKQTNKQKNPNNLKDQPTGGRECSSMVKYVLSKLKGLIPGTKIKVIAMYEHFWILAIKPFMK